MKPGRKKILLLVITGFLLLATVTIIGWLIAGWKEPAWVGFYFYPKTGFVFFVFPGTPASIARLQVGDQVLDINGIPTSETGRLLELASMARIGDKFTYRIKRGDQELSILLTLSSPISIKPAEVVIRLSTTAIVIMIFLAMGFIVYWKKSEDQRAFVFYLLSMVFACFDLIISVFSWVSANDLGLFDNLGVFIQGLLLYIPGSLLIALLLHLALVFPKERPLIKNHPYIFRWIYGLPLLFLSSTSLGMILIVSIKVGVAFKLTLIGIILGLNILLLLRLRQAVRTEGWKRGLTSQPLSMLLAYTFTQALIAQGVLAIARELDLSTFFLFSFITESPSLLTLVLYPLATCVALVFSYRESSIEEKRQIRWPLWGIVFAAVGPFVIGILGFGLPYLFGYNNLLNFSLQTVSDVLNKISYLLIPISFAFAILKYRLMEIDLVIKKTIIYTLLTGIVVVFYLLLVGGLGGLLIKFTRIESQWVTIFSTMVIITVFNPVRNRVQNFVDRRFFRKRYDYPQALRILNQQILAVTDLHSLLEPAVEHLQQTLQSRAVVLFTCGDGTFTAKAKVGPPDEILGRLKFEPDSRLLSLMSSPFEVSRHDDLPEEERLKLRRASSELIVPIKLKRELLGFISLGNKLSDKEFDPEDREFLISAADQMAMAIDNLRLREQEEELIKQEKILIKLVDEIKKRDSMSEISQLVSNELESAFRPRAVHIFFREGDSPDLALVHSSGGLSITHRLSAGTALFQLLEGREQALEIPVQGDLPAQEQDWLEKLGVRLIVPLSGTDHHLLGLLMLGEKSDTESYSTKERELLEAMANQIIVVYENTLLKERVGKEEKIKREVLARFEDQNINLMKECLVCGLCFDSQSEFCSEDQSQLTLSLPVERVIDGKYRMNRLLGRGGMGAVFEAEDLRLGRKVAIKIMLGSVFGDPAALRRFEREARASARLTHPNIITIYDYGRLSAGGAYLVMELVRGETLRSKLYKTAAQNLQIACLLDQLLEGVKAAHQAGIIHRDLKPENVLVSETEKGKDIVKILDFGLAKIKLWEIPDLTSLTAPGMVMGTFGYMPLEQLSGEEVDERCDIFSLGIIVVEALTGQRPYTGRTIPELITSMSRDRFHLDGEGEEIRRLDEVLQKCLARDRGERYGSVAEMQKDLIPALSDCKWLGVLESSSKDVSTVNLQIVTNVTLREGEPT